MDFSAHKFAQSFNYATLNGSTDMDSGDVCSLISHVAGQSQAGCSGFHPASETLVSSATADTHVILDICKEMVKVAAALMVCKCICMRLGRHDGTRSEMVMPGVSASCPTLLFLPFQLLICCLPLKVSASHLQPVLIPPCTCKTCTITPRDFNPPTLHWSQTQAGRWGCWNSHHS